MAFRRRQTQVSNRTASSEDESTQSISATLKDELLLIGFLVLFVGIISTDAYYAAFGVRYQFLNLPSFHIVYRGLTVLTSAPYLLLPYGLVVLFLWLGRNVYLFGVNSWFQHWRTLLSYAAILVMLAVTYPLARYAGRSAADLDLHEATTTLPEVVRLVTNQDKGQEKEQDKGQEKEQQIEDSLTNKTNYRLLLIDSDFAVVFEPIKPGVTNFLPSIIRIAKGDIHVIETNR